MNKLKAAMIGFLPQEGDPYQVLETYAKMGYSAFEGADLLLREGDPAENRKRVEAMGLKPIAVHCGFSPDNPPDPAEVAGRAKKTGVTLAMCYCGCVGGYRFGGSPVPPTYDDLMKECEALDKVAKALESEGISLAFHNHDAEFLQCLKGVPAYYLMAANTEYLKFEVDVGWVTYAGHDPVTVMKALGDRLCAVHIKDFIPGKVIERDPTPEGRVITMPVFTTPGTGALNLKGCLETAAGLGMEYAIVEQDYQYNLTQEETLRAAYLNMKETGFVE